MSKQVMQRALDALDTARSTAMHNTIAARVPECGDFGAIAQTIDYVMEELRAEIAKPDPEVIAWLCQHNETGRVTFVDQFQIDNGWAAGNQNYTVIKPCYTTPPDTESLRKELERVKGESDAIAIDSECFNLWVHEAWDNPSDICRLLSGCETPDDYRAKLVPIIEARKATFAAIAAQGGGE